MFGRMKDPVAGIATVSSYEAFVPPGLAGDQRPGFTVTFQAQVVVTAEGLEPTAVEWITNFPLSQLPLAPNAQVPVIVDRSNPKRIKLPDGYVKQAKQADLAAERSDLDAARAQAQALAEQMKQNRQ